MNPILKQATSVNAAYTFAAIVDSSNDAIISITLDGIITSWNSAAERIFGYTESEVLGKHISLILPQDRLNEEDNILERISNDERIHHYETLRLAKSGLQIPVSLSISPIKNNQQEIIGASKIARDISDQNLAKEKTAMLAAIVDSSDDAIISKNLNGYITSWNRGAENIFGYTEHEAVGKHITLIIPEYRRQEEDMIIGKVRSGEKVEHFETKRITKEGKEIDLSITVSPIKNDKGEITGASKIARDISERVKAHEQLEAYAEQLKNMNKYKDEFISIASHELNTPLTSIKVYLQMLAGNMEAEEINQVHYSYVQKAIYLSGKLEKLVKDLLDVSRIEAGKLELHITNFNLRQMLDDTLDSSRGMSRQHNIVIYEGTAEPLLISGDKDRLEQAFINVISNAIKYSPHADKVIIRTKKEFNNVIVSVEDFGIGIPADQMQNLFSRFFRAKGLSPTFSGLGIGLYLSNQIITRHNGTIEVSSEEGKGSVFTITLPLSVS